MGETVEDLKMEFYQLKADLTEAKEMFFEKSRNLELNSKELKQKNEELKQKNYQIEELQRIVEEQKKQIDSLSKGNNEKVEISTQTDIVKEEIEKSEENTSVLIMGGWSQKELNTVYLLDSKAQSWKKLNITLPIAMQQFGVALVNNEIYIFGGYSKINSYQQNCYKLKPDGTWMKLASLNEKRNGISNSSVVYFGEIWVIGGYSGNQYLKSVEKYNISQNKWTPMPEMNQKKCAAAAAVFKNKIIVTGGYNSVSKTLNSVELFDPELQKWTLFCDIPIKIVYHSMTITGSILTIYGGCTDSDAIKSVWEMDIEDPQKKWTEKQDLKYARHFFGVAKLSNGIMAFGGGGTDTTEIFNGNNWIEGPKLPQKVSKFAFTPIPRSFEETLIEKFT